MRYFKPQTRLVWLRHEQSTSTRPQRHWAGDCLTVTQTMNSLPQQGVTETRPMNSLFQQGHGHCQTVRTAANSKFHTWQANLCSMHVGTSVHALSLIVMLWFLSPQSPAGHGGTCRSTSCLLICQCRWGGRIFMMLYPMSMSGLRLCCRHRSSNANR